MVTKILMAISIIDKALAKNEIQKQLNIQTNAIIHNINNQKAIAIRELESARLKLDAYSKMIENNFEKEVRKIIYKEQLSIQLSQTITHLITLKEYDKALELAKLKPSIIEQNTQKLLS